MKKLTYALAGLLLASLAGTVMAVEPVKFDVQPGFTITGEKKLCPCTGGECKCPTGTCPSCPAAADPTWFACRVSVDYGSYGESGSGTPISCENGKTVILTNAHVVPADAKDRPIKVYNQGRTFPAKWVDGSRVVPGEEPNSIKVLGPDLAFVEIDAEIGYAEMAAEAPAADDQVWQFGFGGRPTNGAPSVKSGKVLTSKYSKPTLVTNLPSESGDSGSGVFNGGGELVGVTWGGDVVKDQYGRVLYKEHCAVPLSEVRSYAGRPILSKLFPKLAERAAAKREARAAKRAGVSAQPPVVDRNGKVDPKYAKPVEGTPKAAAPGKAEPPKAGPPKAGDCPTCPTAGSPPPGDGWQWDPVKKHWWKWSTPPNSAKPMPPPVPPAKPAAVSPDAFSITRDPGCPNGRCPSVATPTYQGPYRRR